MKISNNFITNSSSTSFIAYSKVPYEDLYNYIEDHKKDLSLSDYVTYHTLIQNFLHCDSYLDSVSNYDDGSYLENWANLCDFIPYILYSDEYNSNEEMEKIAEEKCKDTEDDPWEYFSNRYDNYWSTQYKG